MLEAQVRLVRDTFPGARIVARQPARSSGPGAGGWSDDALRTRLHHEERAWQQFLASHDEITALLTRAGAGDSESRRLLANISRNSEAMEEQFLLLLANYENADPAEDGTLTIETEEQLAGQLQVRSRDVRSDALLQHCRRRRHSSQTRLALPSGDPL
jgi:hypothetical protein